jgi:hypothetical protein
MRDGKPGLAKRILDSGQARTEVRATSGISDFAPPDGLGHRMAHPVRDHEWPTRSSRVPEMDPGIDKAAAA